MWACMRWIKQTGCIFLPLNQPVKPTRTTIENHTTITSNLESALGLKPLQPSVTHCLSLMFAQTEKTCSYPLLSSNWLIISEMHWMHLLPRSSWYYQLLSNLLFGGFSQVYASHVGQLTCQQVEEHKIIGNSTNSIFNLISHLGFPNWEQSDASCPRSKFQGPRSSLHKIRLCPEQRTIGEWKRRLLWLNIGYFCCFSLYTRVRNSFVLLWYPHYIRCTAHGEIP